MNARRSVLDKDRLEAFSDGVLAVIITIMVLELKVPAGADLAAMKPLWPTIAAYAVSFAYVGIYWNNHHHLLRAARGVDGRTMWANLHLLFWLSFIPFTTAWVGPNLNAAIPTAVYGIVLLLAAGAYTLLTYALIASNGKDSLVARVSAVSAKQIASLVLYSLGVVCAFFLPWLSQAMYVIVAIVWFIPDRNIEHALLTDPESKAAIRDD